MSDSAIARRHFRFRQGPGAEEPGFRPSLVGPGSAAKTTLWAAPVARMTSAMRAARRVFVSALRASAPNAPRPTSSNHREISGLEEKLDASQCACKLGSFPHSI